MLTCGAAACSACVIAPSPAQFGDVSAGNVSNLAVGSLKAVPGAPVCIGRDANGVYAMSLTCTHAGCEISGVSPAGLICFCHGSQFDSNGNVVRGPATQPLAHFVVTVDSSGVLTIHGSQAIAADQRLKV
jgi:Rieske Fe-S protein